MLKKSVFILIGIILLTTNCTRDDICTEETPKTPLLIIKFYDKDNVQFTKAVENLAVFADTISVSLFPVSTTDSIAIPLKTNENWTDYLFLKNANDTLTFLGESFRFDYERSDEYINRACAFRTNFFNLTEERTTPSPDFEWIDNIVIRTDSITPQTQNEPHIRIYH